MEDGGSELWYWACYGDSLSSWRIDWVELNTPTAAQHLLHLKAGLRERQEAQLSQRDRAMLHVIEYFAKSVEVTEGH